LGNLVVSDNGWASIDDPSHIFITVWLRLTAIVVNVLVKRQEIDELRQWHIYFWRSSTCCKTSKFLKFKRVDEACLHLLRVKL